MEATPPILVIGGGPAGTFAAIAAKKQNPDARVILLTEEPCEPYEKPPLSKGVLLGKVSPADAPIAGPGGLAAHGVALEPCARCLAIDREARALLLEDGRRDGNPRSLLRELARMRVAPESRDRWWIGEAAEGEVQQECAERGEDAQ